jgi:hypothetical protein
MIPRAPALALKHAAERALRRAGEGPRLAEHTAEELRDAYRNALLRQAARPDTIVATCARCGDAILRDEVKVRTALGWVHARHVNGRRVEPGKERGEGAAERPGPSAKPTRHAEPTASIRGRSKPPPRGPVAGPRGQRCRECGCTDARACMTDAGPCWWIEPDLCSACAPTPHEKT